MTSSGNSWGESDSVYLARSIIVLWHQSVCLDPEFTSQRLEFRWLINCTLSIRRVDFFQFGSQLNGIRISDPPKYENWGLKGTIVICWLNFYPFRQFSFFSNCLLTNADTIPQMSWGFEGKVGSGWSNQIIFPWALLHTEDHAILWISRLSWVFSSFFMHITPSFLISE